MEITSLILSHREEGKWMKMNPAAVVLENDDPRGVVVVMYMQAPLLQRGIYILHNRDIFHFLKCHILCSSMSVIYIMLATHLIYDNTKRCSKMHMLHYMTNGKNLIILVNDAA